MAWDISAETKNEREVDRPRVIGLGDKRLMRPGIKVD
jgi:hypothetical protein